MPIDNPYKQKRSDLDITKRIQVAERLQFLVLDEIAAKQKTAKKIVFHGGTSISMLHGSPRWSEDLDFMATPDAVNQLFEDRVAIERSVRLRMSLEMPSASVELKAKGTGNDENHGQVERFMLRWEHPGRIGAVKIKVEFYTCPQERLDAYQSALFTPHRGGHAGRKIQGATLPSIRADKIVAIAQRPMLKHRDIHDLGFISPLIPEGDDIEAALRASMGIYNRTADEILSGLDREILSGMSTDRDGFIENMQRWFDPGVFDDMFRAGHFHKLFDGFCCEINKGRDALIRMSSECGPQW